MSKFHCPWKFSLQVGDTRLPLHLHHEEDLLGGCDSDDEHHTLLLSTDVAETEWSGALNDTERLEMFDARMGSDDERPLFSLAPGQSLPAQLYVSGPSVHSAESSAHEEQPVGFPVRLVCSQFYDEQEDGSERSFAVKSYSSMHERGFGPLTLAASADSDGHVVAVDAFLHPERVKMGSPARMLVDAFRAHNLISSCLEADALLDAAPDMETQSAEAFSGAMRGAVRGVRKAGGAAARGVRKAGGAVARGARKAGAATRRVARRVGTKARTAARGIKGKASNLGGRARTAIRSKVSSGASKLKTKASTLRSKLGTKASNIKSSVGKRVSSLRDKASSKFTALRQKMRSNQSNKKAVDPAQRGKIKALLNKFRNRGKGQQSSSSSGGGAAGGGQGGADDSGDGGNDATAAAVAAASGGGAAPLDASLADPAIASEPAPPLPSRPTALNQAQDTMLQSAVSDGLIAQEQLTAIRASGVSAATVAGIPPSVVSALVVRDPALQQAVVDQVGRVDPNRLLDYRRATIGPLQMTLEERQQYLMNGIAPARMILPNAPQPDELSYAAAYEPGAVSAPDETGDEEGPDEETGTEQNSAPDEEREPDVAEDGSVEMPREVMDFFLEEARQHNQLVNKMIHFVPEPQADSVRLQPEQIDRLLKLIDELEKSKSKEATTTTTTTTVADSKKPDVAVEKPKPEVAKEKEPAEDNQEEEEEEENPADETEPDKEPVSHVLEDRVRRMKSEMELESMDMQKCLDAFAELVGLTEGGEFGAVEAAEDGVDAAPTDLPPFVNASDSVPLSAVLMCVPDEGRTQGTAGAMEFAYHVLASKGEFVDTKLYHAMEAAGDVDSLFEPSTAMDYAELGSRVSRLAAAISRQIHNAPVICPAHGAQCQAH